eukprot:COSAG01_NODE_25520_length_742_cov_0.741835_2_plen_119_part_01
MDGSQRAPTTAVSVTAAECSNQHHMWCGSAVALGWLGLTTGGCGGDIAGRLDFMLRRDHAVSAAAAAAAGGQRTPTPTGRGSSLRGDREQRQVAAVAAAGDTYDIGAQKAAYKMSECFC